jgi:ribonuclease HII
MYNNFANFTPMNALFSYLNDSLTEAGCDEAGRGCLSGPVVAAAVILPLNFHHDYLNDSKQMSERKRRMLRSVIEEQALAWGVGFVSENEIDEVNILNASFLAMHRAIDQLLIRPEFLLIDGNRFTTYPGIPHECIIKGDSKFRSIAAASILAKTYRDEYMEQLHLNFPQYEWNQNKGYPTRKHREAIAEYGACIHHRKSFTLLAD